MTFRLAGVHHLGTMQGLHERRKTAANDSDDRVKRVQIDAHARLDGLFEIARQRRLNGPVMIRVDHVAGEAQFVREIFENTIR